MYHAASMHIIYTNHICMLYNDHPGRPSEMRQRRPTATVHTTHATTQPVAGPAPRRDSSAIVILTPHLE